MSTYIPLKSVYRLIICMLFFQSLCYAQYTAADSLRGGYGITRNWWDLKYYDLAVEFFSERQEISGKNDLVFDLGVIRQNYMLQFDLQAPLIIDRIEFNGKVLELSQLKTIGNAHLIDLTRETIMPKSNHFVVHYHGQPRKAVNPPWDGGVIWRKDKNGLPWISIACQGLGASVWFPCKDSQADEPDSVRMTYTCASNIKCISNGILEKSVDNPNGTSSYTWKVGNPINNYCMIPYFGDYVNHHDHYLGENGQLEVDYWILRDDLEKAIPHFEDVNKTLKAFEYWFGAYPFYSDGYKIVQAPHLGMEHQSAIAYGNQFKKGYLGRDLSSTGHGLNWDFIIVHESGHEWFGNNITTKDIADMWVHESFTNYSEVLFTEYWFGKEAADAYCQGLRKNIQNDKPIIGKYGVQAEGSGDMYYKGSNMLHTIRCLVQDDTLFREMLRNMNQQFYHQTVTGKQIESFMSKMLKMELSPNFDQYLRQQYPPTLEVKRIRGGVKYRWVNCVKGFDMPLVVNGKLWKCNSKWTKRSLKLPHDFRIDPNLYIIVKK